VPVTCFISYARADRDLCEEIVAALRNLEGKGQFQLWYDRLLVPGDEFTEEIQANLRDARLVLLLVTNSFLRSVWAAKEARRALFGQKTQQTRVIPLILEACDWKNSPFGKLEALPTSGRPVDHWEARAEAIADIIAGVAKAAEELETPTKSPELAIFPTDDLREMIETIERSIGAIRRATSMFPVPPTSTLIELAELEARRKELNSELRARGELL
jgi:hypothetical protein